MTIPTPADTDYRGRLLALISALTPDEAAGCFDAVRAVVGARLAHLARIPAPDDPTAALRQRK